MKLVEGQLIHRRYRLDSRLAQGGMGEVWKGYDIRLGRPVAIKALRGDLGVTQEAKLLRLRAEAHNSANLAHPNIAALFEYYEHDGIGFLIMEYVPSKSLADLYHEQNGPMDPIKLLPILIQTARGLFVAHSHGVIHRDVKPANIMVRGSDDAPVLIDFGLSKQYDSSGNQTSTTPVGISHGYAPMEQYDDGGVKEFSPATDIYSLAATLYFLLSGVVPPPATKLVEDELTFPATIPPRLVGPIAKAMSAGRKRRYQDIPSFLNSLTADAAETVIDAPVDESTSIHEPERKVIPGAVLPPKPTPAPASTSGSWSMRGWIIVTAIVILLPILGFAPIIIANWDELFGGGNVSDSAVPDSSFVEYVDDAPITFVDYNGHDYVDLGLSVKWATCNVGASSPSDYGDYFAWGETSTKSEYTEKSSETYGLNLGDIGGSSSFDVARANWGGSWRLHTKAEFEELKERCTWTWTTENGHKGYRVQGPNGNFIFLPAAGVWMAGAFYSVGEVGECWGSMLDEYHEAYCLSFDSDEWGVYSTDRNDKCSVRPVSGKSLTANTTKSLPHSHPEFTPAPRPSKPVSSSKLVPKPVPDKPWFKRPRVLVLAFIVLLVLLLVVFVSTGGFFTGEKSTEPTGSINGHDYVDLGLPSGVKWATCNVGASSPSDYGDYFAWGETSAKSEYTAQNSKAKEKMDDIAGNPAYDAARANWGGSWRLPTEAELEELKNKCTWTWITENGHNGYWVQGPNGNSIFLPAAGWWDGTAFNYAGKVGSYWSSTPYKDSGNAYGLVFDSGYPSMGWGYCYHGSSVRPVSE